jgi:hypothetical protein
LLFFIGYFEVALFSLKPVDFGLGRNIFINLIENKEPIISNQIGPIYSFKGLSIDDSEIELRVQPGLLIFHWIKESKLDLPNLCDYSKSFANIYFDLLKINILNSVKSLEPINRVAINGGIFYKADAVNEIYSNIVEKNDNLNCLDSNRFKDFLYMFNIPIKQEIKGKLTEINRVSYWTKQSYNSNNLLKSGKQNQNYGVITFNISTDQNENLDLLSHEAIDVGINLANYIDDILNNGDKIIC